MWPALAIVWFTCGCSANQITYMHQANVDGKASAIHLRAELDERFDLLHTVPVPN
jgi:hypothetical protein